LNNEAAARRLRAWERFFATGEIDVGTVRPEIGSSWRRCREAGLDPHAPKSPVVWNAEELAARHHRNNAFFDEAVPIMHFLRSAVRETGFILC
jgi:transcriptional regulator of acetoin/glycerol metabolism